MDIIQLWWLTLAVVAVVVLVVVALLVWVARTAERIDAHALEVWTAGKSIANNTVQIWHLQKTNEVAVSILSTAQAIAGVATSIDDRLARLAVALRGDGK